METSCGVVLVNIDSILLLQYPQGHWDLPKGHVEPSDVNHIATVRRELAEETGITGVHFNQEFVERTAYTYRHKGKTREKEVFWFLAESLAIVITRGSPQHAKTFYKERMFAQETVDGFMLRQGQRCFLEIVVWACVCLQSFTSSCRRVVFGRLLSGTFASSIVSGRVGEDSWHLCFIHRCTSYIRRFHIHFD